MGTTLAHGIYLPSEGERNCYAGLKLNWETLDQKVADISALQSAIAGALHREIVESLPTTDIDPNTIYMILSGTSATENVYNEFMYVNNAWELIGTSATDLTNYYTKAEVDGKLLLKANASDLNSHTGDTTIHVTASDKAKWNTVALIKQLRLVNTQVGSATTIAFANIDDTNGIKVGDKCMDLDGKMFEITAVDATNETVTVGSALVDLALDANVVHNSGAETVGGIKSFSDDTFVKSLNFTREVASPSSGNVAILPIVTTVTYTDSSPSQSATVNLRISADGSKSFYPNENGLYSLGLVSRNWDNVFSYMFESFGKNLGNEFSNNARTNLYLKANRDTGGQSGVYISKFRQNRAQGEMSDADVVQVTFDVLENSVRTNRLWYLNWVNWENDIPKTVEVRSLCEKVDYKLTHINGLNPGSLSFPDLSNGIDISSYITHLDKVVNNYTPPSNGWLSIRVKKTSLTHTSLMMYQTGGLLSSCETTEFGISGANLPVIANQNVEIYIIADSLPSAKFYPCLGNV